MEQRAVKHENEAGWMWRQSPKGACVHPNKETRSGIIKQTFFWGKSVLMTKSSMNNNPNKMTILFIFTS